MRVPAIVALVLILLPFGILRADDENAALAGMVIPTTPLSAQADGDFVVGPDYANAPELTARDGIPKGVVKTFKMESKDSKFYPGISKTAQARRDS